MAKPTKQATKTSKSSSIPGKSAPLIKDVFPSTLSPDQVDPNFRDLVEHLLCVCVKCHTSGLGPTSDEIRQWISEDAVALPEAAFVACTRALEEVLALHPRAPRFIDDLIATRKAAEQKRKLVHEFEQARTVIQALKLGYAAGLWEEVGVPAHLVMQLKKNPGSDRWTPPLALYEPTLSHRQKHGWLAHPSTSSK